MAEDVLRQPLLTGFVDVIPKGDHKKRRFRRCKSAPLADNIPGEVNGRDDIPSPPHTKSLWRKIHPSIRKVTICLFVYLAIGTICFYLLRHQIGGKKTNGFIDSVYFCIITMTSVGYGDLVPNSVTTKLLACVFVFTGMAIVCLILSKGADYLVEKQETLLVKAVNMSQKVSPEEMLKEIETHRVKNKCVMVFIVLLVLIIVGTTFLATVEKLDIVDAFYCVCSTITSLGYGDKSFSSLGGRVFAIFWILTSTVCLAQFFFNIAELKTESKQKQLVKKVLAKRMTYGDLEAADLDDDGIISAAEFVLYKLKEIRKIKQEDISLALKEFENLDFDQSGSLSASDLLLSQSSKTAR